MTVSAQIPSITYVGDGLNNVFSFAFRIIMETHLQVFIDDVLQVPNSDYTIQNLTGDGGNVVFIVIPADLVEIRLERFTPQDQQIDYQPFSEFPADTHEFGLDKITLILQELEHRIFDSQHDDPPNIQHLLYGIIHPDVDANQALQERNVLAWNNVGKWFPQLRMNWRGPWIQQEYLVHDVVTDDSWLMIANKTTSERAAPQPTGDPFYGYDGTLINEETTGKQLIFGTRYTVTVAGYIVGYRIFVSAGEHYRVFKVIDPLGTTAVTELINFTATADGFIDFGLAQVLVDVGDVFDLSVILTEPDPSPTVFTGNWVYSTPQNAGTPASGQIIQGRGNPVELRINKTDNDSGDRSAELNALTVGDVIDHPSLSWAIQGITDNGTWLAFIVSPATYSGSTGVLNFSFQTVIPTPLEYGREAGFWTSNPNAQGLFVVDGDYGSIVPNNDAYGADIRIQSATISDDWDALALSGGGGSGSSATDLSKYLGEAFATSLHDGGELNIVGGTDIEIIAGDGIIIDSYTNPLQPPDKIHLSWNTNQFTISAPATAGTKVFFTVSDGNTAGPVAGTNLGVLTEYAAEPSPDTIRDEILIGFAIHNGTAWQEITAPNTSNSVSHTLFEYIRSLTDAFIESDGEVTEAASFQLDQAAGVIWELSRNYINNVKDPNRESFAARAPMQWRYTNRDFSTVSALTSTVDPSQYDNAGVVEPIGGASQNTTIQRLFLDQADNLWVLWGQNLHDNYAEAIGAIGSDTTATEIPDTLDNSILLGHIIAERNSSDWTDEKAAFHSINEFGGGGGGGATSFVSLTDTPPDYVGEAYKLLKVLPTEDGVEFSNTTITDLQMTVGVTAGQFTIARQNSVGVLTFSGGNSPSMGANIRMFGDVNVSNPGVFQVRNDSSVAIEYDPSITLWDFKANDILSGGKVTHTGLPTTDPGVPGEFWDNNGVVNVSQ